MSLAITAVVAVSYIILLHQNVMCQRCTPVDYPPFMDRHDAFPQTDPVQVSHPFRFIVLSYQFGCEGTVTKWELYTVNNGSHPIEFQVWRGDTSISNTFTLNLVGTNYFQDAQPDSNNLLSISVPVEEQIQVQPGDILGISTFENDLANDFRIQDYIFIGTVLLYALEIDTSTPSSLPFQSVNARMSPIHFLPVMNVTVVPEAVNMDGEPQNDDTNSPGSTPLPQSTVIAVAISAPVLVLLSVMLFTAIMCCCVNIKRVKSVRQKSHPVIQEHQVELDYNPAYRDGHSSHHQQQTEPYYSLVTEAQGGVSDTRDSYVEIQPHYVQ